MNIQDNCVNKRKEKNKERNILFNNGSAKKKIIYLLQHFIYGYRTT